MPKKVSKKGIKDRLSLKNRSYNAALSQETPCFSATLLLDGKPVCLVENRGNGECHKYSPPLGSDYTPACHAAVRETVAMLQEKIAEGPKREPFPGLFLTDNLDMTINEMIA